VARGALTGCTLALALFVPATLFAQPIELTPFIGYQIGDIESAPTVGVILDVPLWPGFQIEGLFSHQPHGSIAAIDHWQGGALQEFSGGAARPFLTGMLGLTRYAFEGESEFRFTTGAGGGVKLFPVSHVGARFDGRVFATFLDAYTVGGICGPRGCLVGLHLDVAWQIEFTAAMIIRFGGI
jgi:hypothetical protein